MTEQKNKEPGQESMKDRVEEASYETTAAWKKCPVGGGGYHIDEDHKADSSLRIFGVLLALLSALTALYCGLVA